MSYDLTEAEKKLILENSIERVINTSLRLAEDICIGVLQPARPADRRDAQEDGSINLQDWTDLKWLVVKLWDRERNTIFKELRGMT